MNEDDTFNRLKKWTYTDLCAAFTEYSKTVEYQDLKNYDMAMLETLPGVRAILNRAGWSLFEYQAAGAESHAALKETVAEREVLLKATQAELKGIIDIIRQTMTDDEIVVYVWDTYRVDLSELIKDLK